MSHVINIEVLKFWKKKKKKKKKLKLKFIYIDYVLESFKII